MNKVLCLSPYSKNAQLNDKVNHKKPQVLTPEVFCFVSEYF
ncbi:hypothetical protein [uncultured Gammaproteobacteria bacterium]|nr:hypothetical protein [uncultured Gammaproteobacteria bacterium]SHN91608.1 hypothetical protein BCLUESOX_1988 [bacterium endosymbiont of Bathymodiolus sp. 5 South]CAC9445573.1 hypothetical protein [uncultured Gammaproteobacteria bacterium]CAC9652488.1 hypothetical protein [uncultured Gammaproteobacteria bacterium]CAC9653208.1 hypothetical protein [uncultured Gammaproteobacteria bacterium]